MTVRQLAPPDERQGEYIKTACDVWRCDDDVCTCSQVVVERWYRHKLVPGVWRVRIWEGPFYSYDEGTDAQHAADMAQGRQDVLAAYPDERLSE